MQIPTDITSNRHRNNPQSVAANEQVEPTKAIMRQRIIEWAEGVPNFTLKDVCRAFDKYPNAISGRLSELKLAGLIEETDERREKCAVLRIVA